MLKVYGATQSRAFRVLWMLEELAVEYEHVPISPRETRTESYLAINPNGHVPTLVDGDLTIVESMAVNLYLADRYDGDGARGLWPQSPAGRGLAYQWSFWAMQETEAHLLTALFNRVLAPEEKRDEAKAVEACKRLEAPMRVLDGALTGRAYLATDAFSVADLNVAAVLSWSRGAGLDLAPHANVARWYGECFGRAARKAASRK